MSSHLHFERIAPPPDLVGEVRFFYRVHSKTGSTVVFLRRLSPLADAFDSARGFGLRHRSTT